VTAAAPQLGSPLTYTRGVWVSEHGGPVPKTLEENAKHRARWYTAPRREDGSLDEDMAQRIVLKCSEDFLFWVNTFCWINRVVEATAKGNVSGDGMLAIPMITWPVQDAAYRRIVQAQRDGRAICIEKARDMGASWLCIAFIAWQCVFSKGANWLVISRKEEEVWLPGDQKALFSKIEFIIDHMPEWMRPEIEKRERHFRFPHTGSVISGESTNSYAGVGDRRTGLFVDEAAAIDILRKIVANTSDTVPFRIFNSTNRAGSYFTSQMLGSGRYEVVQMPWWDHPVKGEGRRWVTGRDGKIRVTSNWYEAESAKRDSVDVAENLDMDRRGAGSAIFDPVDLSVHKGAYGHLPRVRGRIALPSSVKVDRDLSPVLWPLDKAEWQAADDGEWLWWGSLVPDEKGRPRPDQRHSYAIGADVGTGSGASPSAASVVDADTGWKVGRFSFNWMDPREYAEMLWVAAHWIGGRSGVPLLVVESNGPGGNTLIRLRKLAYSRLYSHDNPLKVGDGSSDKIGWHSSRQSKREQLREYAGNLNSRRFINPDAYSLDQAATYIVYDKGGCGPSGESELSEDQRGEHGDIVIADMLADLGREHSPRMKIEPHQPPAYSFGWRKQKAAEREKAKARGRR